MHDERYEDIILQARLAEYERVRNASCEKRHFGLDEIRHIVLVDTMYVDNLSDPSNAQPVAGRGIAMQAARHNGSDVQCNRCKDIGHAIEDSAVLKAKEHQDGANQWCQQAQREQHEPRHAKVGGREARRGGDGSQGCSVHQRPGLPHPASQ